MLNRIQCELRPHNSVSYMPLADICCLRKSNFLSTSILQPVVVYSLCKAYAGESRNLGLRPNATGLGLDNAEFTLQLSLLQSHSLLFLNIREVTNIIVQSKLTHTWTRV